jgi:hypothetical protein
MMAIIVLYFGGYILYFYKNMEERDFEYTGEYDTDIKFKYGVFFIFLFQSFFKSIVWPYLVFFELMTL